MQQLFSAIPVVLGSLDKNDSVHEAVVFAAWKRISGELLSERTVPVEFFENRLVTAVEDLTWQRHLEDLAPQMLVKLNMTLGQDSVKFIEFRIDEKTVKALRMTSVKDLEDKEISVKPSLSRAADAIADTKLREQFLSAASVYLSRQK